MACARDATDAQLAARHRAGDPDAFARLHRRHAGALVRHARRLVGQAQADDAVQDGFERLHRFIRDDPRACGPDVVLAAWLRTVVRHRCLDELRHGARLVGVAGEELASADHGPHAHAELREQLGDLGVAVHALPARQRAALVWHALDGASHQDVAVRLDVSIAATKSLVNRARTELRHRAAA